MTGKFITFEGPEGSGKSTHARTLAARLREHGLEVLLTREPGGTPTGESIRGLLQHDHAGDPLCNRTEVLLFCASRAQLVNQVIRPALSRGAWVLCDRFVDSTLAYQGYARGLSLETLKRLNAFATDSLTPDLTFLLDIKTERGFERVHTRNLRRKVRTDRIENESREFHGRLREGYLELSRAEPRRFACIDSDRPAGQVGREIWDTLTKRCPFLRVENGVAGHAR